jgi:hypothetical protein
VIQGHFRALVAQLLQGEGIKASKEETNEEWLDIVTTIAWQAANFVKPDTSRGGSMDPVDYVKVKCIASGNPSDRYAFLYVLQVLYLQTLHAIFMQIMPFLFKLWISFALAALL